MGKPTGIATAVFYASHPGNVPSTFETSQDCADQIVIGSTFFT
jgi:hypothetical protein